MYTSVCTFVAPLTLFSLFRNLRLWNILQNSVLQWFPTIFVILFDMLTKMNSKLFEVMTYPESL